MAKTNIKPPNFEGDEESLLSNNITKDDRNVSSNENFPPDPEIIQELKLASKKFELLGIKSQGLESINHDHFHKLADSTTRLLIDKYSIRYNSKIERLKIESEHIKDLRYLSEHKTYHGKARLEQLESEYQINPKGFSILLGVLYITIAVLLLIVHLAPFLYNFRIMDLFFQYDFQGSIFPLAFLLSEFYLSFTFTLWLENYLEKANKVLLIRLLLFSALLLSVLFSSVFLNGEKPNVVYILNNLFSIIGGICFYYGYNIIRKGSQPS
jgi:hypothetical protein